MQVSTPTSESNRQRPDLTGLETFLKERIRGQDRVLAPIIRTVKRGEWGLTHSHRPRGSLIFLGPTGVGKTETVIYLSEYLFGQEPIRINMSEFQHPDTFMLFLGAGPDDPGRLGNLLRQHTRGFLLFDEIEKAYRTLFDVFLQMLDAARVTDATGRTHDLRDFYLVFTSNIGSERILDASHLPGAAVEDAVEAALYDHMRPELIGRFEKKLVFMPLSVQTQRQVGIDMIEREVKRLADLGHTLSFGRDVVEYAVRKGVHDRSGARPMRGVVEEALQMAVIEQLEQGVSCANGRLCFDRQSDSIRITAAEKIAA
jgi:ATP-dependent Clp protease ATP-binding subunit ClpA